MESARESRQSADVLTETAVTPVALDYAATTEFETAVTINVLANDPGDLSIKLDDTASANSGQLADNGDGTILYTPPAGFVGMDTFQCYVENSWQYSVDIEVPFQGAVTVTVIPLDAEPAAERPVCPEQPTRPARATTRPA